MSLKEKLKRTINSVKDTNEQSTSNFQDVDDNFTSKFFRNSNSCKTPTNKIAAEYLEITKQLTVDLKQLKFSQPVECVYDPTEYAIFTHSLFVNKYLNSPKQIMFLGMNPGPYGMSQTGVPFGEVAAVRDWLNIYGPVSKPAVELPARPITGFECKRSEVSGYRFWNFFKEFCKTPENVFKHAFVHNYCPLIMMKKNGKNVTPAEIKKKDEVTKLHSICDEAFIKVLKLLETKIIVGVGKYAEKRALTILKAHGINDIKVLNLIHPSPIIPHNQNWNEKALQMFTESDLIKYFVNE